MTYGSLFAGVGGLDLGFDRAGFECKWQVEINEYARRVLAKHWPNVRRWDDVQTFPPAAWQQCECCENYLCTWHGQHAHDCPDRECPELEKWDTKGLNPYEDPHPFWSVDLILGGDPCQSNSAAVGGSVSSKPSLGGEFIRVVDVLRPRLVLRENPTFARKDAPWPWWRFRSELESLGYAVLPFRLRACCFGAFHQRDRLFLLAERTDASSKRLERRQAETKGRHPSEPARRVHANDWLAVHASRGFGSRAGLPDYVERVTGLGNAVYPDVAEYIARRILAAELVT